jgi:ABC-type iron transport system FetAB ATPase subunit
VSYLEGCTAPMRDENQLHAAVVELVALDDAQIKYSTVQNWYPGDKRRQGRHLQLRHQARQVPRANAKISWTQVETGSAITWKYPSCILQGDNSVGEFYSVALTNNRQQADTGTKMIHIGKNTRSTIVSKGISAGHGQNTYRGLVKILKGAANARNYSQCDSMLIGDQCGAHTFPYIEVRTRRPRWSTRRRPRRSARTRSSTATSAASDRGRGVDDRQRLLQGGLPRAADGVRGRGAEAAGGQPRRQRRLTGPGPRAPENRLPPERRTRTTGHARDQEPARERVDGKEILKGHRPDGRAGEVHAIMGPNGSGKSTLAAGAGRREATRSPRRGALRRPGPAGDGPEERAREGVFLAFQYPVEIPGVSNTYFLKAALNAIRKHRGEPELDAMEFLKLVREKMKLVEMDESLLNRPVNEGFSGGEKKRNEIFQMAVLEPRWRSSTRPTPASTSTR